MGHKQANKAQASASFAGATGAANQNLGLSKEYNAQQGALFNSLFGAGAGGGGTLSAMMNPASLNVSGPTGPHQLQYNKAVEGISNDYRNARGNLSRDMASRGFGSNSPAYFGADQARGLASDEAATKGAAFTDFAGKSYEDALRNFWGATGIAADTLGGTRAAALGGAGQAGGIYGNLYGTSGQPVKSIWSDIIGAAGQAGGALLTGVGSRLAPKLAKVTT